MAVLVLAEGAGAEVRVGNLRCEYRDDPRGIDETAPRLSWIMESFERGQRETAYRVLVAGSAQALAADSGDLWDSGKVESDQSIHVEYAGKALTSHQECWWKVRVWDKDGNSSQWSEPAVWSMGILNPTQWQAKWIGHDKPFADDAESESGWRQKAPSPMFRKKFNVDVDVARAVAYTCGLGYHDLYVNGQRAGDAVLQPPFTRYDRRCVYTTHDVTGLLTRGNNAIGVMLGNGFYNVHTRAAWDFDRAYWRKRPRLLLQLHLFMKDGTERVVTTDANWKATTGPLRYDGVRQGEVYDARLEQPAWTKPAFDDRAWADATVVGAPGGVLSADMAPPIRVVDTITPPGLEEVADGVFVYDLGQNIAGWVQLRVKGKAGTQVRLRYAERVCPDGSLDQREIAKHVRDEIFQTDTYILRGGGPEVYEPRFVYHGFQYVEVTGYPGKPTRAALRGRVVQTDFEKAGSFACSNPLLNDIQRLTDWAYCGNFVGYPMDCPHREKNGWTGDAHLAAEQAMFNWHNEAAYTKWMTDFADEQRPDGVLPAIIPTGGWGYKWGNGPAWDSAYLLIPWYMYLYEGDTRILERHYEGWKRYVDYLMRCSKQGGIVSIGLGDWAPAKSKCPVPVTSTGYYYTDTRIVAEAARILGREQDAGEYAKRAAGIRKAFERAFAKGNGLYADGSQTALSCAVYNEFVEPADVPAVIAQLVANVERNNGHIDTGILGAKYLFHALSENGAHEMAYRVVTQKGLPGYAWWVEQGATTLWEHWDGRASRNHVMFGDISAWFYRQLAGIRVDSAHPGFKHFFLKPQPVGDLEWVEAHHDCPYGRIVSHWQIEDGRFRWEIVVPPNTTATLHVPTTDAKSIAEGGKLAGGAEGLRFVREEQGAGVFTAVPGTYALEAAWTK